MAKQYDETAIVTDSSIEIPMTAYQKEHIAVLKEQNAVYRELVGQFEILNKRQQKQEETILQNSKKAKKWDIINLSIAIAGVIGSIAVPLVLELIKK